MDSDKKAFLEHMAKARDTVAQWPQWKQDILRVPVQVGDKPVGNPTPRLDRKPQ